MKSVMKMTRKKLFTKRISYSDEKKTVRIYSACLEKEKARTHRDNTTLEAGAYSGGGGGPWHTWISNIAVGNPVKISIGIQLWVEQFQDPLKEFQ